MQEDSSAPKTVDYEAAVGGDYNKRTYYNELSYCCNRLVAHAVY